VASGSVLCGPVLSARHQQIGRASISRPQSSAAVVVTNASGRSATAAKNNDSSGRAAPRCGNIASLAEQ